MVSEALAESYRMHGGELPAAFERGVRVAGERRQFWSRFSDVPDFSLDTASIARDWRTAREAVSAALIAKQSAPLERIALSDEARAAVAAYKAHRQTVASANQRLQSANTALHIVKERAVASDPATIANDLARLRAVKSRHTSAVAALCDDYLAESAAKAHTEQQRDQTRSTLDQHRVNVFPGYQTAINLYLERFNAGFRLDSVTFAETRGGPTCTYNVLINNTPVPVAGGTPLPGEPSFRNTLSSGDRNTLALAFFFASLDQDSMLANKVVVIDDPIASLDEHRSWATVQEIRSLAERAGQVIVLSHSKPFLCRIWEGADRTNRAALQVARDAAGSTILTWDVDQDSITEHDRRHTVLRMYLASGASNSREVARAIRPLLEAFLRVAYPEHFPPGTLLGSFRALCELRVGTTQQILITPDVQELGNLIEYANKFHHDTNAAWETEAINDGELRGFVHRALRFARR